MLWLTAGKWCEWRDRLNRCCWMDNWLPSNMDRRIRGYGFIILWFLNMVGLWLDWWQRYVGWYLAVRQVKLNIWE
jgi:hypothetical protein